MKKERYSAHDEINGLLNFIDGTPTPYHAAEQLAAMLDDAGAVKLNESELWGEILPGMLYYFVHNDSAVVAFRLGSASETGEGWRVTLTHLDYPGFRIKPNPSNIHNTYERLNAEVYGGMIHHSWFDRPLGLAGRIYTRSSYSDDVAGINITVPRPLAVIPELAIHMNRDVNNGARFNPQTEMLPFFSQDFDDSCSFTSFISAEAGVDEEDILSYDLSLFDTQKSCTLGQSNEFISAPHLDDGEMVYCAFRGFIEASENSDTNSIIVAFDHEEVGSVTDRGAGSGLLRSTLERILDKSGCDAEEKRISFVNSIICSADMAHAGHPSYPGTYDPEHTVYLNKGIVLKHSFNQSYIESPKAAALFRRLCEDNRIPYQDFVNRNDLRGGSTVGPRSAADLGALGFDVGNAIFSMHSLRETGGAMDIFPAVEFFEAFNQIN